MKICRPSHDMLPTPLFCQGIWWWNGSRIKKTRNQILLRSLSWMNNGLAKPLLLSKCWSNIRKGLYLKIPTATLSGPYVAASASDSTFSTVVSISGKSLNVSKSLFTRKSAVFCVDSAKLAVRSQSASHSFSHPVHDIASTGKTCSPCPCTYGRDHPAVFWLPLHFLRHLDRASWSLSCLKDLSSR